MTYEENYCYKEASTHHQNPLLGFLRAEFFFQHKVNCIKNSTARNTQNTCKINLFYI